MRTKQLVVIALLALLTACSTALHTERVPAGSGPKAGVLYNLPSAILDVEVKFLVTSCSKSNDFAVLGYRIDDAKISHSLGPDSNETYRLDYALLNSPTKTTSASVVMHPNGMIKSINADIEDRTAQVATSIAGTALNLLKASLILAAPTSAGEGACHKLLLDSIGNLKKFREIELPAATSADSVLAENQKRANEAANQVETIKAKIAAAVVAKDAVAEAAAKAELPAAQGKLNAALTEVAGKKPQAPAILAKIAVLKERLTATAKLTNWIPTSTSAAGGEICKPVSASQTSFNKRLLDEATGKEISPKPESSALFKAEVCVNLLPNARMSPTVDPEASAATVPAQYDGVVYRLPTLGTVFIREDGETEARITAPTPISFPQFGAKGLIWLRNGVFDKNNVKVSFNEDGSLLDMSFATAARAERAASAASDVSKTIVDMMQLRADAAKAKAKAVTDEEKAEQQEQLDSLDAQISLLQKQKALESASSPAKDAMDKESDLLQKEIALEKLRQELSALKKKVDQP